MVELEHTRGEWVETYNGRERYIRELDEFGDPGEVIAEVFQADGSDWEANARLIQAVPDLLAALEPFAYLAQVMEEGQYLQFRGVYVSWKQAQAAAAAIAKARGE